jgi:hypothetical protein
MLPMLYPPEMYLVSECSSFPKETNWFPNINAMTGSFAVDFVPAGREIRRLRQSSEISLGITFVLTPPVGPGLCRHTVPGIVAFTTLL